MLRQSTAPAWPEQLNLAPRSTLIRSAAPTTQTDESIVVAAVHKTVSTSATSPIVYNRLNRHSLADLDVRYVLSDLFNNSAELVTDCQGSLLSSDGMRCCRNDTGAVLPFMEICCCQRGLGVSPIGDYTSATDADICWFHLFTRTRTS